MAALLSTRSHKTLEAARTSDLASAALLICFPVLPRLPLLNPKPGIVWLERKPRSSSEANRVHLATLYLSARRTASSCSACSCSIDLVRCNSLTGSFKLELELLGEEPEVEAGSWLLLVGVAVAAAAVVEARSVVGSQLAGRS